MSGKPEPGVIPDDGTAELIQGGTWILIVGVVAALLTKFFFGGSGRHGPHTSTGWLLLVLALMALPFGLMLLLLGVAKWLRNRTRQARAKSAEATSEEQNNG